MKLLTILGLALPAALTLPLSGAPETSAHEDLLGATLDVLAATLRNRNTTKDIQLQFIFFPFRFFFLLNWG